MQCYQYTGTAWSDSNPMTWENMGNASVGIYLSGHSICYYNGVHEDYCAERHRYVYDITELAEMWAAGSVSPAQGIVFRATGYYEEGTTNTYKTFASINRAGENYPQIKINYMPGKIYPDVITIEEGSTTSLASGILASQYVEWQSTDSTRATVDANGTVTGVAAGKTTINLINTENDENEIIDTCVVYVTVNDLYDTVVYLKNNYNGLYIGAQNKNENVGSYVNFYTQEAHPYQMWNLELDVDQSNHIYTGRFKIQELHSLGLVLEMQESAYASNAHHVLTADGSIDNERQYWYLKRVSSSYFAIVSDYNEYALTYYNNQLVAKANYSSSYFSWSILEYQLPESEIANMYATTTFTNHNSRLFTYSVSDELLQSELFLEYGITLSDVKTAVEQWNGISDNVYLRYTADENSSMIKIVLAPEFMYEQIIQPSVGPLQTGDHAVTYASNENSPTSRTELFEFTDSNSQYIHIFVSPSNIMDTILILDELLSEEYDLSHTEFNHHCALCDTGGIQSFIESIITHEIGHALKLRHYVNRIGFGSVVDNGLTSVRILLPSIMQGNGTGVSGNRTSLLYTSSMDIYAYVFTCFHITQFDKMVLRYKYNVIGGIS